MSDTSRPLKRKRVSVVNKTQEIADPKRKRVLLSTDLKTRTYHFWYNSMLKITKEYGFDEIQVCFNINLGCQIQSVLYSAHSHCRQVGNGTKTDEVIAQRDANFVLKGIKYSKPLSRICEILRAEAQAQQLEYKKFTSNTDDNWISVAAALFSFLQNFKNRMKEVRVGHSKVQVGKAADEVSYIAASDYGIEQAHQNLLEGASYPPHVKSSTAQSLGPATLMIMVMEKGQEAKFGDKWKEALLQCLGTLVDKEVFVKTLAELGPTQSKALVQLVCDILALTTTKQIHRAYFAPSFMMVALTKATVIPEGPHGPATTRYDFDPEMPQRINNTGRGLFATYMNKIAPVDFTMYTDLTEMQAAQLCFHSMFGTYTDNLNVLKEITDFGNWDTRNEFGDRIKGIGADANLRTFKMPKFRYWAKMATAMQSNMLGGQVQEILPNSVFSGPTRIKWNKYLNEYYRKQLSSTIAYTKPANPAALREKYMVVLQGLVSNIDANEGFTRGATVWHKVTGPVEYENKQDGNDPDIVPGMFIEPGIKTFLGGDLPTE